MKGFALDGPAVIIGLESRILKAALSEPNDAKARIEWSGALVKIHPVPE